MMEAMREKTEDIPWMRQVNMDVTRDFEKKRMLRIEQRQ